MTATQLGSVAIRGQQKTLASWLFWVETAPMPLLTLCLESS